MQKKNNNEQAKLVAGSAVFVCGFWSMQINEKKIITTTTEIRWEKIKEKDQCICI